MCSSIVSSDGTFVDAFLFTADFALRVFDWFSLAFSPPPLVQFGVYPFWFCGVYMWGVGHGVSSHKF